jgi:hypothetical protein
MFEINFHLYDHNFCESTIYSTTQHPEYLNSISSLFISVVGIYGIFQIKDFLFSFLYSCLIVNGILSFYYHYYNSIGFGLLDRMSMVLLGLSTTLIFIQSLDQLFHTGTKIFTITTFSYYSILLTVAGLHIEWLFNLLFTFFLCSILLYMYIIYQYSQINKEIIKIGIRGAFYILCSGLFWVGTELLCHQFHFIKFLFGHVWWHIFVSYGGYLVSLVPYYIKKISLNQYVFISYQFGIPKINIQQKYDLET